MRKFFTLIAMAALISSGAGLSDAMAKGCRDEKGKFIKCAAAPASNRCRDIKTKKFAKCGLPGTEAVP
jgi:hypothetical protein